MEDYYNATELRLGRRVENNTKRFTLLQRPGLEPSESLLAYYLIIDRW